MSKNIILSVVCCFCLFSASLARAQWLNVDAPETISDSSNLIGKVTDHIKEAQKYIENSQLGKAVGDGIKYAKQGISYAKDGYAKAMNYYNQGMEYKDELVNSPEFKIAKKSAEIAKLEEKIRNVKKQQEQDQQETDDKISLVQAEADAKIKNLNKNLANTQILMADGDNEQARAMAQNINNEIAQIRQDAAGKVAALQKELQQKTGIKPQKNSKTGAEENKTAKIDDTGNEAAVAWEISGQDQDNLIAALKPGAQIVDTLQEKPQTLQNVSQQAQSVKELVNDNKILEPQKVLSIKEEKMVATPQKRQRVSADKASLLKQAVPAKRISERPKTITAAKKIRE